MFGKCLVLQESKLSTQKYVNKDYEFLPNCEFRFASIDSQVMI